MADSKLLAVFAGHGSRNILHFGYAHNGSCQAHLSNNMRLGAMNGATAGFGMWLACEVLNSDDLMSAMRQSMRQQAGFENTISIGDNEPRDFFNATDIKANSDAWLDEMGDSARRAIIATFHRNSQWNCWDVHNRAKLRGDAFNTTMGGGAACGGNQPTYYACWEERQN